EAAPAVIAAGRNPVDFFEGTLAHVVEPQLAPDAIETPAPGITQAEGVDLWTVRRAIAVDVATGVIGIGIRRWNPIGLRGRRRRDVDAKHLAEKRGQQLPVSDAAVIITMTAACPEADVKESVGTEGNVAAVVIDLRVVDVEQHQFAARRQRHPVVER